MIRVSFSGMPSCHLHLQEHCPKCQLASRLVSGLVPYPVGHLGPKHRCLYIEQTKGKHNVSVSSVCFAQVVARVIPTTLIMINAWQYLCACCQKL